MNQCNRELLEKFTYVMRVKKYSENTIRAYESILILFFNYIRKQSKDISINDFEKYILHVDKLQKLSFSYHSQLISSWKLYLLLIYDKKLKYDGKYIPRKKKNLIEILSVSEVWQIINSIKHSKQRAIISGIYLHGLRRSEILEFKYSDIDRNRGLLVIRQGKGKKDRLIPLNETWIKYISIYARESNHKKGYDKPMFYPYSVSSISNVIKSHAKSVGVTKRVYPHLLRDCYASHLLEQGIDATFIQEILGHEKLETTRKYLHISAVNISKIALKAS